jgi:3-oxoacyl-[acyl-carrier protein] reductase
MDNLLRAQVSPLDSLLDYLGGFRESLMDQQKLLYGKKVLVTGAGRGIGRAIGLSVVKHGADICVSSRTLVDLLSLEQEIKKTGSSSLVVPVVANVSVTSEAKMLVDMATRRMKQIDVVICAAGYPLESNVWESHLHELNEQDFLNVFKVDVLGSFNVVKNILPSMIKRRKGSIILFSSTPAIGGYDKGGPYTVAKAANLGLVKEIASEYGKYNIRCNAIAPGNIKTGNTFDRLPAKIKKKLAEEAPLGRWGDPGEVARVVCLVASDEMSFVTGQTFVVDGGTVMN